MKKMLSPNLQVVKDYLMITLGIVLVVVGIYFFKFPNNYSTGGVSGIGIILGHYIPNFSPASLIFLINMGLLIFGVCVFGRSFGIRTAYASLLLSGLLLLLEKIIPLSHPLTTQPLLELIFAVLTPAIGSAILFNTQSSSGGTDIIAMYLKKKTSINIGNCLLTVDFLITGLAFFAFGIETGLLSMLGLLLRAVIVDMVLENIKVHKCFQLITSNPEPIKEYIVTNLKRGATTLKGEGAFTHENKEIIMTVVNRSQAIKLRNYVKLVDPTCFILITNSTEIIGKGFRNVI